MNAAGKWHEINWDKINFILDNTLLSDGDDPQTRFWLKMAQNSKMELDEDGNLPKEFTWQLGYRANLPLLNGQEYLCLFESGAFDICVYDDEQDFEPCFWDRSGTPCKPIHWAEVNIVE